MNYSKLVEIYEKLESIPSKHGKRDVLAEFFKNTDENDLGKLVLLVTGKVFPTISDEDLGIASNMMKRAIARSTGHSEKYITELFRESGDLGLVAETLVKKRTQSTLMSKQLTVEKVFESLKKLSGITGIGSQERKLNTLAELLTSAKPEEAKYIVRTTLGILRIGVAEGIVKDAIAKAFDVETKNVEHAWNMNPDYSEITKIAKHEGDDGLKKVTIKVGTSVQVLLAEKSPDLKTAIKKFDKIIIEIKYDGARVQIHRKDDKIKIFTRRLEDVTKQFPDIVKFVKSAIHSSVGDFILDGEMIAIDYKMNMPLPFQILSQRIQRKHNIEKMAEAIPVEVNIFDILYIDGKSILNEPLSYRRDLLEKIISPIENKFVLSEKLITTDVKKMEKFYQDAITKGHEGIMVKNIDSKYQPGKRVGYWLKVKPIMEPLDLVIIGADWGTGKRARWLSSFILGCFDETTGNFLPCGMMGTGLTDEQFKDLTKKLKPLVIEEEGRHVKLKPNFIFEIGYEEIQKSPKYESGFALRFPRMIRDRTVDKSLEDVDSLKRIKRLYSSQRKISQNS